jgi:hypothetical protein
VQGNLGNCVLVLEILCIFQEAVRPVAVAAAVDPLRQLHSLSNLLVQIVALSEKSLIGAEISHVSLKKLQND